MHMFVLCYVLSWSWLILLISLRVISLSPGNLITFQCQGNSRETNKNICHRDPLKPDNITTANRNTTKVNAYSMECTVISPGKVSMMTSSMEKNPALLALCAANSPVTGEFPAQRPVTRSFDVFFDPRLNKWLSKRSWGWWFDTPLRSLWRHYNEIWILTWVALFITNGDLSIIWWMPKYCLGLTYQMFCKGELHQV